MSNSIELLSIYSEASQRPVLEAGDILVVHNFATHHGDAEVALQSFLNYVGMELLYLPAYSPDLNPDEDVFSKLKYLLNYQYQDIVFENLEYAVWCAGTDLLTCTAVTATLDIIIIIITRIFIQDNLSVLIERIVIKRVLYLSHNK